MASEVYDSVAEIIDNLFDGHEDPEVIADAVREALERHERINAAHPSGQVNGKVPVYVVIEDGEVTQVVVDDENLVYDDPEDDLVKWLEDSENNEPWPGWEFGW